MASIIQVLTWCLAASAYAEGLTKRTTSWNSTATPFQLIDNEGQDVPVISIIGHASKSFFALSHYSTSVGSRLRFRFFRAESTLLWATQQACSDGGMFQTIDGKNNSDISISMNEPGVFCFSLDTQFTGPSDLLMVLVHPAAPLYSSAVTASAQAFATGTAPNRQPTGQNAISQPGSGGGCLSANRHNGVLAKPGSSPTLNTASSTFRLATSTQASTQTPIATISSAGSNSTINAASLSRHNIWMLSLGLCISVILGL